MCSWLKRTKQWELRTVQGLIVWHMLSRYTQSSTVQKYQIYRLTEYIRYMFTTESLKGNLLIQMWLTFTYKTHMYFHAYVWTIAFPIHVGDSLVLASVNGKRKERIWKVRELLWSENEKSFAKCKWKVISPILRVTVTFQKVVTFSKSRYFTKGSYFPNKLIFLKSCYFFPKDTTNWIKWV